MGLVRLAVTDSAITFLWVIYIAFMRPAAVLIASLLELGPGKHELLLVMALLGLNNFLFGWLGVAMGGALWNPAPLLAFYSVGASKDTLFTIAARYPAQAVGAVGGVLAVRELIPPGYKHLLRGPRLMVGVNAGMLAEFVLTSVITFSVLFAVLKGPRSPVLKTWIIVLATYAVVLLGAGFTGPSLNPAHAFAWAYVNNKHHNWEHVLVFWLAPLAGSFIASQLFQLVFPKPTSPKEKSA